MTPRLIASYQPTAIDLSTDEVQQLSELSGKYLDKAWDVSSKRSRLTDAEKVLVKKFKAKVKTYLFHVGQGNFCCYCGYPIDEHQASHDAEHCISKVGRSNLVFSLRNLALSCKSCNGSKGVVRVRIFPLNDDIDEVSVGSDKYRIINPHFDRWSDHLKFDSYGRVVAIYGVGLTKGRLTIKCFGIDRKNAMALANKFDLFGSSVEEKNEWLDFYVCAMSEDDALKKRKYETFLGKLIALPSDPAADELRKIMEPALIT